MIKSDFADLAHARYINSQNVGKRIGPSRRIQTRLKFSIASWFPGIRNYEQEGWLSPTERASAG